MTIGVLKHKSQEEIVRVPDNAAAARDLVLGMRIRRNRVQRCLFGHPASDPKDTVDHISRQLEKLQEEQKLKWGFDFVNETPIEPPCNFTWEKIDPTSVPQIYREESAIFDETVIRPKINENRRVASEDTMNALGPKCKKFRQTTIHEYWRCAKRSNSTSQPDRRVKTFKVNSEQSSRPSSQNQHSSVQVSSSLKQLYE